MDNLSLFQNALARLHVPELIRLHARPDLDHRRRPVVVEGSDALVARIIRSDGARLALRVAAMPDSGRDWHLRYADIGAGAPPAIATFLPRAISALPGGFSIDGVAHEAVLMEWIDGPTLLQAADRAARAGNGAVLRALASSLRELGVALRQSHVVHGDLAADNLLMRANGDLIAVDLDSLSWPGARLGAAGHGTPGYRHPAGVGTAAERDAFGMLAQYVSLLVLADDPDLRRSFGDPVSTHGGALLFTAWDIADPRASQAFREARERVSSSTQTLLDGLAAACVGRPARAVETLGELFALPADGEDDVVGYGDTTNTWDLSSVIQRLREQYGERAGALADGPDWEGWTPEDSPTVAAQAAPRAPEPESIVPMLQSLAEDRELLRQAIASGNEAEVVRLAARLGDDPVAQMYKIDVERILTNGYRTRIADAFGRQQDDVVLSLAEEVSARHLPLDAAARAHIRRARERVAVRRALEAALAADDRAALTELAVSGKLVVLGDTDRASLHQVLRALEWPGLQRVLGTDDDTLILEWYDEDLFGQDATLPDDARARIDLARARLAWLDQVRQALRRRDARTLAPLFLSPPDGAMGRLAVTERTRANRLIERQAALDALQLAMRSEDDAAILTALHAIERVGARLEDRFTWGAVRRVVERATVIENIIAAATANPPDDRQLATLLPVAKTLGLARDPQLTGELAFERLEAQVLRGAALRRIRKAIASGDDVVIRQAAWPDVADAHSALTPGELARIAVARERTAPRRTAS